MKRKELHTVTRISKFEIERLEKGIAAYKRSYEWLRATKEDVSEHNADLCAEVIRLRKRYDAVNREKYEAFATMEATQAKLDEAIRDRDRYKAKAKKYKRRYLRHRPSNPN